MDCEDDGFGPLISFADTFSNHQTNEVDTNRTPPEQTNLKKKKKLPNIPKQKNVQDERELIVTIYECLPKALWPRAEIVALSVILHICGKRNLSKTAILEEELSEKHRDIYRRIRQQMQDSRRRQHIIDFLSRPGVTRRLINYFVVHFS